ncbi:ribonuclease III domain-containing protein [Aspergillus granulosus]|uniref:Ribonuclease III domain-containing protein n=1 Tax=Aspergillus granulosus TaxID=176169 RepID=A0ABR4GVY1_9EURO
MRLVAEKLCNKILKDVGFLTLDHVLPAITTPYTRIRANYQRYEFFGDSILKYIVSCQLFFAHDGWSEGDLSRKRDALVQNPRLTRAALELGLDAYVLERRINRRKWSAPTVSQKSGDCASGRAISAKVLADVVESLIGAAFLDGGVFRARACIQRLLPEIWLEPVHAQPSTRDTAGIILQDSSWDTLQTFIGYSFKHQSILVEALTHSSFTCNTTAASYQRLEFLGDAILDMIIMSQFARYPIEMQQDEMSMIKHAVSNRNLLAFFCLDFLHCDKNNARSNLHNYTTADAEEGHFGLWRFMRFHGPSIKYSQQAVLRRYFSLRDQIALGLQKAKEYPWQALIELNADKYLSDLIESVLGAIFIDSSGDLASCEIFLQNIGLLGFLTRILRDRVNTTHPKILVQKLSKSLAKFTIRRTPKQGTDTIYECTISIRNVQVAVAESCLCREEAEVKAAAAAIQALQETPLDALVASKICL